MMLVKIKLLTPNAVLPDYATDGSAGLDLTATSKDFDNETHTLVFGTGIAVEIPQGYVGLIFPRSSIYKTGITLANSVGVIDSDYRGEITFRFHPWHRPKKNYEIGDRIGQLVIVPFPKITLLPVSELETTKRGEGGYGSTGK